MKFNAQVMFFVFVLLIVLCGCNSSFDPASSDDPASEGPTGVVSTDLSGIESEAVVSRDPKATAEQVEPTSGSVTLPDAEQVRYDSTPVMWEFTHDCVGYYSGISVPFMVAMVNEQAPTTFYVARYSSMPVQYVPKLGSSIHVVEVTLQLYEELTSSGDSVLAQEGGWVLLNISDPGQQISEIAPMYEELWLDAGHTPYLLATGHGYDTDVLRGGGYADALMYECSIDIFDPWWDTWRYGANYSLLRNSDQENLGYITTQTPGMFLVYSDKYQSGDGGPLHLSNNDLWMTLVTEGLTLEGAPEIQYVEEDNEF